MKAIAPGSIGPFGLQVARCPDQIADLDAFRSEFPDVQFDPVPGSLVERERHLEVVLGHRADRDGPDQQVRCCLASLQAYLDGPRIGRGYGPAVTVGGKRYALEFLILGI